MRGAGLKVKLEKYRLLQDKVILTASRLDTENEETDAQTESDSEEKVVIDDTDETHEYRN